MIWKTGALMGALLPVAAAALAADKSAVLSPAGPSIWYFFGYPFEAGSMIAAICACIAVRLYVAQKERADHRWNIDLPVSALTLMTTATAVIRLRPDPALALIYGTGIGALGVGLITIALNFVQSKLPGGEEKPTP
ncbi:putative membrane protein [Sphingomonas sp. RIT328]|nr:putative membrane protein [Sphingomonas sp. RIT328]